MANEIDSKIIIRENNLGDGLEFDTNNKVNLKLGENSPVKITDGVIDNNVSLDYDPDGKTISLISGKQILPLSIDNLASTTEVEEAITSAVENLDVSDNVVLHKFVTAVNETDGKISVTRSALAADDMPDGIHPTKISSPLGNDNISTDISTLSSHINTLNGDDSTTGSVSNSIKTAIEALDVTATTFSGALVPSSISETDGKINVTSRTLTKGDLELGNVDNTSDANKPISTATKDALDNKLSVTRDESGVHLAERLLLDKLHNIELENGSIVISSAAGWDLIKWGDTTLTSVIDKKVNKVEGKQLSTEDYTTAEKNKLNGIEAGAQVNVDVKLLLLKSINAEMGKDEDNTSIDISTSDGIKSALNGILKAIGFTVIIE